MTEVSNSSGTSPSRKGEVPHFLPAALVFLALFQVIGVYVALKAVRDSLFLHSFGAMQLPFVMLGIAVVVGLFSLLSIRLAKRFGTVAVTTGTLLFFATNLILFWRLSSTNPVWLPVVLYLWVGAYGVIAPVQVWTLANQVFSTRQARRLYGPVGAGGILGAIAGGVLTSSVAQGWGTLALLPLSALVLVTCSLSVVFLFARFSSAQDSEKEDTAPGCRDCLKTILDSPHLKTLAALVFVSALATTLIDFQFKATAGGAGMSRDQMTSFFGAAYSAFSVASLGVQMLAVRPLLGRWGLGPAILVAPFSLLLGSSAFALSGGLAAAAFLKGADGSFKHSLDRSSKELAWLPVPWSVKVRTKSLIDMVADRMGDGTGGLILLVLATGLHLPPRLLTLLNFFLAAVWISLAWRLKRSYYDELGRSLGVSPTPQVSASLARKGTRQALLQTLASAQGQRLVAALDVASLAPGPDLVPALNRMVEPKEDSDEVSPARARALELLLPPAEKNLPPGLPSQLGPEDRALMVMGFDLVLAEEDALRVQRADAFLEGTTLETRATQLALLVRRLGEDLTPVWSKILDTLTKPELPVSARQLAARTLGLVPDGVASDQLLPRLLADPEADVRLEAAESAGRLADSALIPHLLPLLGERSTRPAACRAITAISEPAVSPLLAALADDTLGWPIRRHIPRLLALLGSESAVSGLVRGAEAQDNQLSQVCLEALVWFRRQNPAKPLLEEREFQRRLLEELTTGRTCLARLRAVDRQPAGQQNPRLVPALQTDLEQCLHRVRLLLQLGLPSSGFLAARHGLTSRSQTRRENALELLEGLLPRELKFALIPFLEETAVLRALPRTGVFSGTGPEKRVAMHDISLVDRLIALRSIEALHEAPAEALLRLAAACRELHLDRGEAFSLRAQSTPPLLLLTEGRLLIRQSGDGPGCAEAGESKGSALIALHRSAHVVALKSCHALLLDREAFFEFLAENGDVACSLVDQLLRQPKHLRPPLAPSAAHEPLPQARPRP